MCFLPLLDMYPVSCYHVVVLDIRFRRQHLVVSPSSLFGFPSGPRLDMDPDIVAALDEDFDYDDPDNILDDDFIVKANSASRAADPQ